MGFYTTSKTTKKRDKCISKKQAENSALQKKIEQQQAEIERLKAHVTELEAAQQWIDPAAKLPDRSCPVLVLLEHYNMPSLKNQAITSFHPSPDFFNHKQHYEIVCSDECPANARHFECSFDQLQYSVKGWMLLPKGDQS